jgi:hypothetical protein
MLRFIATCLIAVAIGLMVGATLAVTIPADEPRVAEFQRPGATTSIAVSTIPLSEPARF